MWVTLENILQPVAIRIFFIIISDSLSNDQHTKQVTNKKFSEHVVKFSGKTEFKLKIFHGH